eukprot:6688948-Ditylum_brightwellii.AAC.1
MGDLNEYIHSEQMQKFCSEAGIKITEGGYPPLHFGYKSNHCFLCVKFSLEYIFGSIEHPLQCPMARNVQVGDLKGQRRYKTHVRRYLRKYKIKGRLIKLLASMSNTPTPDFIQEYERIESIRARACRVGVHKCKKLHVSGVSSHPEVKQAQLELWLIDLLIKTQ